MAGGKPQFELELPFTSPYKRTQLFIKDGRAFFGIWRPLEVELDGDEETVLIQRGLDGHLDLVAFVVYGDRRLWRVIAQANKIDFPLEEVTVGRRIIVPKPTKVRAALLASGIEVEVA